MRVLTWTFVFGHYPVAHPEAGVYDRIMHSRSEVSGYFGSIPANVPLYAWNLAGYEASMMPTGSGNRHEFGGFSDSAFSIMQTLEAGRDGRWPWEVSA